MSFEKLMGGMMTVSGGLGLVNELVEASESGWDVPQLGEISTEVLVLALGFSFLAGWIKYVK